MLLGWGFLEDIEIWGGACYLWATVIKLLRWNMLLQTCTEWNEGCISKISDIGSAD